MARTLALRQYLDLPFHPEGDFDHGDVYLPNGHVFIANTAAGTVEVVDGERLCHLATIPDCPEASGVLTAQDDVLIFAAARGAGKLLVINAISGTVIRAVAVGSRPNGLAWDARRHHLLAADVQDNTARLVDPMIGQVIAEASLPGRPRWAVYHQAGDRFLINIREPAVVAILEAESFTLVGQFPVSSAGPHGLDLDQEGNRAFVACDGGNVVTLDLASGSELARVPIAGIPDAIWHNHRLGRLYVAIANPGVVAVVNTSTMVVEESISTEAGTHTTAFDALRQRLYVFLPSCRVAVYEERGCAFLIVRSDDAHSSEKENIPMKWITREHVKVDRVACPWLIKKFVDKDAEFLFVPTDQVMEVAEREGAIPYDVKAVELGHHGKECSFEAILKKYGLTSDPALVLLGKIVNGADTDNSLWHQPEGEGLEAIAEGFRHLGFKDDHEQNAAEWIVYDALYAYCQEMVRQGRPDGAFKAVPSQEAGKTNPWDRTGVQPAQ